MLFFHVITALISLITASVAVYRPSKQKLTFTYAATAGTIVSGVLLMVLESVSVSRACISGGLYLVAVVALIIVARRKMAAALLY